MFIWPQNKNREICGFRFKSPIFLFDSTQTVAARSVGFLSNYLLVYWPSFFVVAGWQAFGISLARVEHIQALFQFWSVYIYIAIWDGVNKNIFLFPFY